MASALVGHCWYLRISRAERNILQLLCDHAKDDGTDCRPGLDRMSWMGDYSRAQIQRIMRVLERKRLIIPVGYVTGGRGHTTEYEIHLENGELKPEWHAWQERLRERRARTAQVDDTRDESLAPAEDDYIAQFWAWLERNHYRLGSRADSAKYQAMYMAELEGAPAPETQKRRRGRPRAKGGSA